MLDVQECIYECVYKHTYVYTNAVVFPFCQLCWRPSKPAECLHEMTMSRCIFEDHCIWVIWNATLFTVKPRQELPCAWHLASCWRVLSYKGSVTLATDAEVSGATKTDLARSKEKVMSTFFSDIWETTLLLHHPHFHPPPSSLPLTLVLARFWMMQCCPNSPVTWQDAHRVGRERLFDKWPVKVTNPKTEDSSFRMMVATDVIRDPGVWVWTFGVVLRWPYFFWAWR